MMVTKLWGQVMLNDQLESLAKRLAQAIPTDFQALRDDISQNFQAILQGAFVKLDLVTRSEFDVQAAVLAKTRAKLEELEQRIQVLEQQLLK